MYDLISLRHIYMYDHISFRLIIMCDHISLRLIHTYDQISLSSTFNEKCFIPKFRGIKTHISFSVTFFSKFFLVLGKVENFVGRSISQMTI